MLLELIRHTITQCPKHIKKMGYLYESISIESKYKRCTESWQSHIQNCKSEIINKIESMPTHDTAIILGAGSLLDIPLIEISRIFNLVILIDIVKPAQIKNAIKQLPNCKYIQQDITGIAEEIYNNRRIPRHIPEILFPITLKNNDLVISANIASQLPILPLQFIGDDAKEDAQYNFAQQLIRQHLTSISKQDSQYIILTDYKRIYYNKLGKEIYYEDALYGVDIQYQNQWDWNITPINEHKDYKTIHTVASITNNFKTISKKL